MRILLKLEPVKNAEYDLKYFNKLQGFIYNLIKGKYSELHDKGGYKFFCFSNIFPIGDFEEGDEKNLIVSSPDKLFINTINERLNELSDTGTPLNIGELQFKINKILLIRPKMGKNTRIITATPITLRIPEKNYELYKIPENFRKKRYVYWRPQYSFEAFIKQLEENLFKKYNEFYSNNSVTLFKEQFPVFEQFLFKKFTISHLIINGKEYRIPGSIWEFRFSYLTEQKQKLLNFGIECGFGERNSFGFGFVNVVK